MLFFLLCLSFPYVNNYIVQTNNLKFQISSNFKFIMIRIQSQHWKNCPYNRLTEIILDKYPSLNH